MYELLVCNTYTKFSNVRKDLHQRNQFILVTIIKEQQQTRKGKESQTNKIAMQLYNCSVNKYFRSVNKYGVTFT
jgi:hypothetical protein